MKYCAAVDLTKELKPNKEVRYEARAALRQGLEISEVPFSAFRDFYTAIVAVKKPDSVWEELSKKYFAFMATKDGMPITAAAFTWHDKQVYYGMAVTDFSSPFAHHASYLLQVEVMKALKTKGYEWYVVGTEDKYADLEKSKRIWNFKKQFGDLYTVEEDNFPFQSYTPCGLNRR